MKTKLVNHECTTVGGGGVGAGVPCVFPFKFKDVTYETCADFPEDVKEFEKGKWCATKVDHKDIWEKDMWGACEEGSCSDREVEFCADREKAQGTRVIGGGCSGEATSLWYLEGSLHKRLIKNVDGKACLAYDPETFKVSIEPECDESNGRIFFEYDDNFQIKGHTTDHCLDYDVSKGHLLMKDCDEDILTQKWHFIGQKEEQLAEGQVDKGPHCKLDEPFLIQGHDNKNLQDHNGDVRSHANKGTWERWKLFDAGNGKVYIRSWRNENLKDHNGKLQVTATEGLWEQWEVQDAGDGDGKVFIRSWRKDQLRANSEGPDLTPNRLSHEKWKIIREDGTDACTFNGIGSALQKDSPSKLATKRIMVSARADGVVESFTPHKSRVMRSNQNQALAVDASGGISET